MKKKTAEFGAFTLLLALIVTACPSESPSDPKPAGEITITNIPAQIKEKNSYKIYVSLSDSTNYKDRHIAQGTATLAKDQTSVTVPLFNPPENTNTDPDNPDPDPDKHGAAWSGTAKYFSVTISPKTVSTKDDIEAKGGMTFNESSKNTSWDKLMGGGAISQDQLNAIFTLIICKDDAIDHP